MRGVIRYGGTEFEAFRSPCETRTGGRTVWRDVAYGWLRLSRAFDGLRHSSALPFLFSCTCTGGPDSFAAYIPH